MPSQDLDQLQREVMALQTTATALTTLALSPSYANDAAAAAGGVILYGLYRNGSIVQVRVT